MHLIHVSLQRACRRELPGAQLASEVPVLLMLKQDVHIFKLFFAVVAEWFEDIDASFLAAHLPIFNYFKFN